MLDSITILCEKCGGYGWMEMPCRYGKLRFAQPVHWRGGPDAEGNPRWTCPDCGGLGCIGAPIPPMQPTAMNPKAVRSRALNAKRKAMGLKTR